MKIKILIITIFALALMSQSAIAGKLGVEIDSTSVQDSENSIYNEDQMLEKGIDVETVAAIKHLKNNAPGCLKDLSEEEIEGAEAFAALSPSERKNLILERAGTDYEVIAQDLDEIKLYLNSHKGVNSSGILQSIIETPDVYENTIIVQVFDDEQVSSSIGLVSFALFCPNYWPFCGPGSRCSGLLPNCLGRFVPLPSLSFCGCGWLL